MPPEPARAAAAASAVLAVPDLASLVATIRDRLARDLGDGLPDRSRVVAAVAAEAPLLAPGAAARVVDAVTADLGGLGPLQPFLGDDSITDVLVNGTGEVFVERHGVLEQVLAGLDHEAIRRLIERVVLPLGLRADPSSPIVDARLPDGARVHAVLPPLAVDGPTLAIRRFAARPLPLEAFAAAPVVAVLRRAVSERRTILISGGTGAGKTTLLNALAAGIPAGQRIVTVEDAAELRLPQPHVVRLEARPANAEGVGATSIRDLVRSALRLRPDRLIVGECRGGEALDVLQAMNTGHAGSLCTCHANGPDAALRRMETMALLGGVDVPLTAVREQVHTAIDLIVHVERDGAGHRRVAAVAEVAGSGPEARTRRIA